MRYLQPIFKLKNSRPCTDFITLFYDECRRCTSTIHPHRRQRLRHTPSRCLPRKSLPDFSIIPATFGACALAAHLVPSQPTLGLSDRGLGTICPSKLLPPILRLNSVSKAAESWIGLLKLSRSFASFCPCSGGQSSSPTIKLSSKPHEMPNCPPLPT